MAPGPLDLSQAKFFPIAQRRSLVFARDWREPPTIGADFRGAASMVADELVASKIELLADRIVSAAENHRPVALGMGAHAIKLLLGPYIVKLMEMDTISSVAMNGAAAFHDLELALYGATSEDVARELPLGRFGFAEDSAIAFNEAARSAYMSGRGLGEALAELVAERAEGPGRRWSILAASHRLGKTVTVHVAIGTDVVHMHPSADGAALGASSMLDFRKFCAIVAGLAGGVYINLGSAVVMPEVFLKGVSLARNMGFDLTGLTTANLDMLDHYRPRENVLRRIGGEAIDIRTRHELSLPALYACIVARLNARKGEPDRGP